MPKRGYMFYVSRQVTQFLMTGVEADSEEEAVRKVKDLAKATPDGEWMVQELSDKERDEYYCEVTHYYRPEEKADRVYEWPGTDAEADEEFKNGTGLAQGE